MSPRKFPKYCQPWVDHEGRPYCYFRRPGYPRVRLRGLPWSPQFMAAYEQAMTGPTVPIGVKRSKAGSLSAAIASYYGSGEFCDRLRPSTQKIRRAVLEKFRHDHGDKPIALMPKEFVERMLRPMRPGVAHNWLKAVRGLMQYCVAEGLCREDVTAGIKLKAIKSDGHHCWTEDEIARFESHHPVGSKARLALGLLLYLGQRRGDTIRMGRQHVRDGVLTITQEKTGVTVAVPLHPELRRIIDAAFIGAHLTFIVTERGRPFSGQGFTEWFRRQCDAAGLPKRCVVHGLRKAAARRLAEASCSVHEIAAITGHATLSEVQRYTHAVDRQRLARSAMERMRTNIESATVKLDAV
jgi:integrase